jgi:DNA-directed RNA polymerase II subunit RPB1
MVITAINDMPYIFINEYQRDARGYVPEPLHAACFLMIMLTRSLLHPNVIIEAKITPLMMRAILDKMHIKYSRALIAPGTAFGIIAALAFSEPLTQYMLDAHHRAATGGTSMSAMIKAKGILSAKNVDDLKFSEMFIPVNPKFAFDKSKVQEIANSIEVTYFENYVMDWQIFFEQFKKPIHPKYVKEIPLIEEFITQNPLIKPPIDLIRWCIRFTISRTQLIIKHMPLELIISRLRDSFPEMYFVYTSENSPIVFIRAYMRSSLLKSKEAYGRVKTLKQELLSTVIRGMIGVKSAQVVDTTRTIITADGALETKSRIYSIETKGTNLIGVFGHPDVDPLGTFSDAVQEISQVLGIEAARQQVISDLRELVDVCNHRHYMLYADEMTRTGFVTSIESSGVKEREHANVLLRMGFSSPFATIEEAAIKSMSDTITGVTAPLLIGGTPQHGTIYNKVIVNPAFVRKNVRRPDDIIDLI